MHNHWFKFCLQDRFQIQVLLQGVQGISDIITIPGLVNVDFADVKAIMCNSGTAMLGVGVSSGKNRAEEAAAVGSSIPAHCHVCACSSLEQRTMERRDFAGGANVQDARGID